MEAHILYQGLIISRSDNRVLDDKVLGIDRELHPNVPAEVSACYDAGGFVNPLGPTRTLKGALPPRISTEGFSMELIFLTFPDFLVRGGGYTTDGA